MIRLVFWLGGLALLLPTDERQQARLLSHASYAVHWTLTFCERNEATCRSAREVKVVLIEKAQFGLELASRLVDDWANDTGRANIKAPDRLPAEPQPFALTAHDRVPVWRGVSR